MTAASGILDRPVPSPPRLRRGSRTWLAEASAKAASRAMKEWRQNPHGRMTKQAYSRSAIPLESNRTIRIRLHAWRDGQAARRGDGQARPRGIAPDAADARRDDGRRADLSLHAGAGTAGARHHLP